MKSILENRPALTNEVNKAAEVAGYLWQKGWAERNGGNIVVNITEFVDDEIRNLAPISEVKSIGTVLPYLKGCYFYCKGTNKRMRDLRVGRWNMVPLFVFSMIVQITLSLPTTRYCLLPSYRRICVCTIILLVRALPIKHLCTHIPLN